MYIDPWSWYREFQWQAIRDGNQQHLRLPSIYRQGWQFLEAAQYDASILAFKEGLLVAQDMQMPMWEFFFESWVCEVSVLASDYKAALDWTTRLVSKSVKPEHRDHPCRAVVYFTLAWVYFYLDAHGYETDILQALDTLENGMPLDEETHHRSIFLRAEIAYEKEQYTEAIATNDRYMNLVEGNAFRESSAYGLQRAVSYAQGDLPAALSAARLRGSTARTAKLLNNAVNSVIWEAVLLRYMGEEAKADSAIQRANSEYDALNLPKQSSYYHIVAEYYTAKGDLPTALHYRDLQLALATESGSLTSELYCRLDRCYLLNKMGEDATEELASAENAAKRSKKPDFLLQKLESAKEGQSSRYSWQLT